MSSRRESGRRPEPAGGSFGPASGPAIALLIVPVALCLVLPPGRSLAGPDPARVFVEATQDYDRRWQAFVRDLKAAKNDAEVEAASAREPARELTARRLLDLALAHPRHPVAFPALAWVVARPLDGPHARDTTARALDILLSRHIDDARMDAVCMAMQRRGLDMAEPVLAACVERSPHRSVRGLARDLLGARVLEEVRAGRREREPRALELLEDVARTCKGLALGSLDLGQAAQGALFEHRSLRVGLPVPEIQGKDLDGRPLALSAHRGNVTVLKFWGDW
jgi:hypothetical protein